MNHRIRQQTLWEQTKALQGRVELISGRPRIVRRRRRVFDLIGGLRRRRG